MIDGFISSFKSTSSCKMVNADKAAVQISAVIRRSDGGQIAAALHTVTSFKRSQARRALFIRSCCLSCVTLCVLTTQPGSLH